MSSLLVKKQSGITLGQWRIKCESKPMPNLTGVIQVSAIEAKLTRLAAETTSSTAYNSTGDVFQFKYDIRKSVAEITSVAFKLHGIDASPPLPTSTTSLPKGIQGRRRGLHKTDRLAS